MIIHMTIPALQEIYERELNNLKKEISAYTNEEDLWKIKGEIKNSGGNLCLHLLGNLQHFIGAVIDNTGYIRLRDLEFSKKNIPLNELLKEIDTTISVINKVFASLNDNSLKKDYPVDVFGKKMTTIFFLIHLTTHLSYHLGQINYHRRLVNC
jgi:hypothetical protein